MVKEALTGFNQLSFDQRSKKCSAIFYSLLGGEANNTKLEKAPFLPKGRKIVAIRVLANFLRETVDDLHTDTVVRQWGRGSLGTNVFSSPKSLYYSSWISIVQ